MDKPTGEQQAVEDLCELIEDLAQILCRYAHAGATTTRAGHALEHAAVHARQRKATIRHEARTARLRVRMAALL